MISKLLTLSTILFISIGNTFAQVTDSSAQWTWMKGNDVINMNGVYGTQGIPAPGNQPGSRTNPMYWTDAAGNFWLFGGGGNGAKGTVSAGLNDLWKYNPSTNEWTWVNGQDTVGQNGIYGTAKTFAPGNRPGGRSHGTTWIDASGNLWLFGGSGLGTTGTTAANLNDLWKYDPTINQWAYMTGSTATGQAGTYGTQGSSAPANTPGARNSAMSWVDAAGNLWLFGGNGYGPTTSAGNMNDVWKYNPTTNEWTWITGLNGINQVGTYGAKNTFGPSYKPGGRQGSAVWQDANGYVYIFGGTGYGASGSANRINDLWKYDMTNNQWAYVNGGQAPAALGVYGTRGVAVSTNQPGGRAVPMAWKDINGKFWLFGGLGFPSTGADQRLNDLWMYDPVADLWTWMRGPNIGTQAGVYGTKGIRAVLNTPGGRGAMAAWKDNNGNFWAFGGTGLSSTTTDGRGSDLWLLSGASCVVPIPVITTSKTASFCQGDSVVLRGAVAGSNITYRWLQGTTVLSGKTRDSLTVSASGNYSVEVSNGTCADTSNATTVTVYTRNVPAVTPSGSVAFCQGDSATMTVTPSGAGYSYQWLKNGTSIGNGIASYAANAAGSYRVVLTNSNNCSDTSATVTVAVNQLPVVQLTPIDTISICQGENVILNAGQGTGLTYRWKKNNTIVGTSTPTYTTQDAGDYKVIITNSSNCTDSSAATTVKVFAHPVVAVTPADTSFCIGNSGILHVAYTDTDLIFQWKKNNDEIPNATSDFYQTTQPGSYYVVVSHDGVCNDSSAIATVTVNPLPVPVITRSGDTLKAGSHYATYKWYLDGQAITTATDSNWLAIHTGAYVVEVTDTNGCNGMSMALAVDKIGLGLADLAVLNSLIKVYPNPTGSIINITTPVAVQLTLYSMDGRIITQTANTRTMDLSNYANGVYILQITDAGGALIRNERIVKQNW